MNLFSQINFSWLELYAAACVAGWSVMLYHVWAMTRENVPLSHIALLPLGQASPRVTVIVPACNESGKIEAALRSLCAQTYTNLRIIAINDRSTDATPEILNRLALEFPNRLRVIHISSLPEGWLGKNHANQTGYEAIETPIDNGGYILFTDADVMFGKNVIAQTVAYAVQHKVGHIVAYPNLLSENIFEESFLAIFSLLFTWKFNPRAARDPNNTSAYIGVGAFNFIAQELYERIGTHQSLKNEVADDVMLGYRVKQQREATHVLNSESAVSVRWREGLWDSVRGIIRSAFPGVNFSWLWVGIGVIGTFGGLLAPYGLWLYGWIGGSLFVAVCGAASVLLVLCCYSVLGKKFPRVLATTLLHPVMSVLFLYAMVRSAVQITVQGGVVWRGTFYSIEVLRRKPA